MLPAIALGVWILGGDEWMSWSATLLVVWFSTMSFMAVRWRHLNQAFAAGQFTAEDLRSNPRPYVLGPPLFYVTWIVGTIAVLVAVDSLFPH